MKTYLITFRSITYAQRAQKAMERQGLRASLRRTARWMEERGCGYAVEVKLTDILQGTALLHQEGIPFRKGYRLTADGTPEEVET